MPLDFLNLKAYELERGVVAALRMWVELTEGTEWLRQQCSYLVIEPTPQQQRAQALLIPALQPPTSSKGAQILSCGIKVHWAYCLVPFCF